jgi:hypothetical protein
VLVGFPAVAADRIMREVFNPGLGYITLQEADMAELMPATGQRAYDNWRSPNSSFDELRGRTNLTQTIRTGSHEVGDDLVLADVGASELSDLAYSVVNLSSTDTLGWFRRTIRWYSDDFMLVGQDSARVLANFQAGSRVAVFTSGFYLLSRQIPTSPRMFMTLQYTEVTGIDPADIGMLTGGPVGTGSSSQFIRNFTTGQQIDLGSENQNLGFFIDSLPIPAPGSFAAFVTAIGIFARRRQR